LLFHEKASQYERALRFQQTQMDEIINPRAGGPRQALEASNPLDTNPSEVYLTVSGFTNFGQSNRSNNPSEVYINLSNPGGTSYGDILSGFIQDTWLA